MSNLSGQITPLTKGILWLGPDISQGSSHYREIDYLLDGLLTASLQDNRDFFGKLIVGENFGSPFYVMIVKHPKEAELHSFLQLIKKDLMAESNIVVIDENASLETVKPLLKELVPFFKIL
jgi:hypothetical protein